MAPTARRLRVLETSPRLRGAYGKAMNRWFEYTASDFDERGHAAAIKIDLQEIALPSASIDVLLTPHVLEHVPDTSRALREIHRVLAPGGRMYLQIPILQGQTRPPSTPEFHDDNTPVFWRFGPADITDALRSQGFTTTVLCLETWAAAVSARTNPWQDEHGEFAVSDMLRYSRAADLAVVATTERAEGLGLFDGYQFLVFEAIKAS
jgi:SAM-dependent methyltransferase